MTETFADVLAYGGGRCEFRLVIEGCPLEPCTHPDMRGVLASGARRVDGLRRDGLSFMESADLPRAEHKSSIGSVTIEDTDDTVAWNKRAASFVFSKIPRVIGYLSDGCTSSATTLTVRSSAEFSTGTVYHLDTEAVLVTAKPTSTTLTVTRAMWGTTAQAHYVTRSTIVGDTSTLCQLWDAPPTYRRRRVWIYGHGADELTTSDTGTLLARGVISTPPQLSDGMTWSLSISPITSLLDAEIGPREGSGQIVGIYYPGASPYRITVNRRTSANRVGTWDSRIVVRLVGLWRSQSEWCGALTSALNTAAIAAGWTELFSARPVGTGWELFFMTAAAGSQRYLSAEGGSAVDGVFNRSIYASGSLHEEWIVSASTEYRCGWEPHTNPAMGYSVPVEGLRGVPRSTSFAHHLDAGTPAEVAAYPWHAFYLASVSGLASGQLIRVAIPANGDEIPARAWEATIASVDASQNLVIWAPDTMWATDTDGGRGSDPTAIWTEVTPASLPTVSLPRAFGDGGNVADMLEAVWNAAADEANLGSVPFLLSSDFASAATLQAAVLEAAGGAAWLLHRRYVFGKAVRLIDVVKHELRLLGAFLATDANGAITIRPITTRLDTDATIAAADLVNDESFGELVTEPDGILTGYTIRTGYDCGEDEHKGSDIEISIQGAIGIQRARQPLEVAPKSTTSGSQPSPEEIISHLGGVIALWSSHRMQVTFEVKLTHHAVRLGDCVYVTIPQLPYDAERSIDGGGGGMISVRGTVVGRRWPFAEPAIELTVLFDSLDVAGYTPTGRVASQAGATTTWTLTLEAAEYGPGGAVADADFFIVGMKVRLIEWDTTSPTVRTGTVTSRSGNTVGVELDAAWVPGASIWNLLFSKSTTPGITAAQLGYAWIARDDFRVHLASGTQDAKRMAP